MRIVFEDLVKTVAETQIVAPITRLELLVGLAGGLLTAHFIEILHRQDYTFLNMEELCHEGFAVRGCALASNEKYIRVARLQLRISRVFYVLRVLAIVMAAVVTFPADILPDDAREKFAHLVQIEVPCITNAVAFLSIWVATVVICIVFNMFGRFVCHMVIDHLYDQDRSELVVREKHIPSNSLISADSGNSGNSESGTAGGELVQPVVGRRGRSRTVIYEDEISVNDGAPLPSARRRTRTILGGHLGKYEAIATEYDEKDETASLLPTE